MTFVAKKDSAVTINGNPINQFQTEGPYVVDGNPNYETYLVKNLEGNIYSYIHNSVSDGLGKIGVIINIKSENLDISDIGKNICMHIAALNPKSISKNDLSSQLIESEKEIIKQQLKESGKPDNILEKMLEGKMNKFFEENTLLGQKFVVDPTINVETYLDQSAKSHNCSISIIDFVRFEIGS